MAFNIADITKNVTGYINENKTELVSKSVLVGETMSLIDVQVGYKSSGAINLFETELVYQNGTRSGRESKGGTTIKQRILTVGDVLVSLDYDVKKLEKTWLQMKTKAGSEQDALPFAEQFVSNLIALIGAQNEECIWQGDTEITDTNSNLRYFDGLLKVIDADNYAKVINGNPDNVTEITKDNAESVIDTIHDLIPVSIINKDDVAILCGYETFRNYIASVKKSNYNHYSAENKNGEIMIAGTNTKLKAVMGMNGTGSIEAGRLSGFTVGTDLENESEDVKSWYSDDDRALKFDIQFKLGTQIKHPAEHVSFRIGTV